MRLVERRLIYSGWGQSLSPGNEQRDMWGSAAAKDNSTSNYGGISDPGIDALIDDVVFAKDRDFQDYLKSPQAQRITPTLRVRRANANDGAEATTKKPVSVAPVAPQTASVAAGSKA